MEPVWAIGLMTGTVLDGMVDIAMLRTDGEQIAEFGPWSLAPYPDEVRDLLSRTVEEAVRWDFNGAEPAIFAEAERALTQAQAMAVDGFLKEHGLNAAEIAAIGFHGQTVLHRPPAAGMQGQTRQLGDGERMARIIGTKVIYDFRSADVEAGGQGAPLAPIYHCALLDKIGAGPETAILNLGGVANITWRDGDRIAAFDTGPANAPINDWISRHGAGNMDIDGGLARSGRVDEERLALLLEHPYLRAPFPKSLDRHSFAAVMAEGLDLADGAALLTAFTAGAVGKALDLLPQRPSRLVVCGGGRKNPAMMDEIRRRARVEPVPADRLGLRGDAIEAECFAFLAMRSMRGLPISFPETTGVPYPMAGGRQALAGHVEAASA
ncbi:anhydro-N-acetylmuramic acid kinase [Chelativorans sp. Marseille-P2723]|uniref:anhydro-N-acetylmuramic acid kinase n=1 Tax=Chelativorans sp. Marseille-P2723 TaxID=2709133 RepID=UPI00156FB0EA|nr:anhydro-N-acetylmuramic acid kinase [Chelativorans sp. Marseille-P2723]